MNYDQRSAAFLEEMGIVPLWTLRAAPAPQSVPDPVERIVAEPEPAPPPAVAAAVVTASADAAWEETETAVLEPDIAQMDWAQLRHAIANCTRCTLCKGKQPVYGSGARKAAWMVAAGAAGAADEQEGQPVAGDAGRLLTNMLAAAGLARETDVYVTSLIKCRPTSAGGGDRAPTAEQAQACRPYLERELALTGAPLLLTLGQIAANALQDKPLQEPLAQSRGQVIEFKGVKMVSTLHPGELLRRGADKALAWADLCLAKANDGRTG